MKTKSPRFTTAVVAAILIATILSPSTQAADQIEVQWAELPHVLEGRVVSTVLVDGTVLRGRILDVSPTELRFEVKKTSNRDLYPKGEGPVPREQLRVLSYTEKHGNWRAIGTAIGVGGGALASMPVWAPAANEGGQNELTGSITAAVIGIGAAAGYAAGLNADTHKTIVVVAKDEPEANVEQTFGQPQSGATDVGDQESLIRVSQFGPDFRMGK